MDSTITVGITGGIGAGKSIICRILHIMGYPVFYSDTESRKILDQNPVAREKIIQIFGEQAYSENKLNRNYISQKVFENKNLLAELNAIAHPLVRESFNTWKVNQKANLVFNEAAVLFETGSYLNFSHTILVTAPDEVRIKRVKERDQTSADDIKKRMKNQWSDDEKRKLASFVVVNDDKQALIPQLHSILKKLTA